MTSIYGKTMELMPYASQQHQFPRLNINKNDYHEVKSGRWVVAKETILVAVNRGYFFVMYLENTSENSGRGICKYVDT